MLTRTVVDMLNVGFIEFCLLVLISMLITFAKKRNFFCAVGCVVSKTGLYL